MNTSVGTQDKLSFLAENNNFITSTWMAKMLASATKQANYLDVRIFLS